MKAIIQHLRFPFSLLLLPVFVFGLLHQVQLVYDWHTWLLFFILHGLVYPSSNGFNSYNDDDQGSIGMIENPVQVPNSMRFITLGMDAVALILSMFINFNVCILLVAYILASRLYSWRTVRLKQFAILGFVVVFIFQGAIIYAMVVCVNNLEYNNQLFWNGIACSCLIGAGYPLSQIYQHVQDKNDGVNTISMMLGYTGTFIFSGILFAGCSLICSLRFMNNNFDLIVFIISSIIVGANFLVWFLKVRKAISHANFANAMRMNLLSCIAFNICFIIILIHRLIP